MAHRAIQNLRDCQRQLDMDGCEVGVSRQALDETLEITSDLLAALSELLAAQEAADQECNSGDALVEALDRLDAAMDVARAAIAKVGAAQ